MLIFFTVITVNSIVIEQVPGLGSPPRPVVAATAACDSECDRMWVFGGEDLTGTFSSKVFAFDRKGNYWMDFASLSDFEPPGLTLCKSFFYLKKFYVLFGKSLRGISDALYVFDIENQSNQSLMFSN